MVVVRVTMVVTVLSVSILVVVLVFVSFGKGARSSMYLTFCK